MRRALAAAILGFSLWLGSLAWTGFTLLRTVLDPDRSREVAESLYEDEAVRAQLVDDIADGVAGATPPGVSLPRGQVEATAADALDSPAVATLFVDAFARTHAAFLGEGEVPDSLDPGAFGSAARGTIVARNPELDAVLPASPELAIPLPTDRVPNLGPLRDLLQAVVPLLALASATGALLALLVTSNRPAVIRRAGVWAVLLSSVVLIVAYGVPALGARYAPGQSAIIAALVGAMAGAMRVPAFTLGGLGAAGIVASVLWRRVPSPGREPARRRPRPPAGAPRPPRRDLPRPAPGRRPPPAPAVPRTRLPDGYAPGARRAEPAPVPRPAVTRNQASPTTVRPDPTRSDHDPTRADRTRSPNDPTRVEHGDDDRRWVEGVGWVVETSSIPPDARWVPGVGYVVDER